MAETRTFLARLFQRVLQSDLRQDQIQAISLRLVREVEHHHLAEELDREDLVEVILRVAVRATKDTTGITAMEVIQVLAPEMATAISRTPVMGEETLMVQDPEAETTDRTTDNTEITDSFYQRGFQLYR